MSDKAPVVRIGGKTYETKPARFDVDGPPEPTSQGTVTKVWWQDIEGVQYLCLKVRTPRGADDMIAITASDARAVGITDAEALIGSDLTLDADGMKRAPGPSRFVEPPDQVPV